MRLTYTNPVNNRICYLTCKRLTDKRHWQFCKRAILSLLTCWSCSVRESLCVEWTSSLNDCTRQIRCPKAKTWNSVTRPQFTVLKHVFIVFQTRFSENLKANFPSSQASTSMCRCQSFSGYVVWTKKTWGFPRISVAVCHGTSSKWTDIKASKKAVQEPSKWWRTCTYHSESEVIEEVIRTLGLCKLVRRGGVDPHLKLGCRMNVSILPFLGNVSLFLIG